MYVPLDQSVRDKALKALKVWLKSEGDNLDYAEFLKLWKGLHYCMWMADKSKYQHELADNLADLANSLSFECSSEPSEDTELPPSLLFIKAFWETICREWKGIDRLRLNKYYYLMEQFMKVAMEILKSARFGKCITTDYFDLLFEFPLNSPNDRIPKGVKIFFIENYVESIRSLNESFDEALSLIMLSPLLQTIATTDDKVLLRTLDEVLSSLYNNHEIVASNESSEDDSCDNFDFGSFSATLFEIGAEESVNQRSRKLLYKYSEIFQKFGSGTNCLDGCSCDH